MPTGRADAQRLQETLQRYIAREGLKASKQRSTIAEVFFQTERHLSVEELLDEVRKVDPKVSQATVYRTLRLLRESGLAEQRNFLEGQTRWELSDPGEDHHDHLMCRACGEIIEFVDEAIEQRQERIAADHGFKLVEHRMELYGEPNYQDGACVRCGRQESTTRPE